MCDPSVEGVVKLSDEALARRMVGVLGMSLPEIRDVIHQLNVIEAVFPGRALDYLVRLGASGNDIPPLLRVPQRKRPMRTRRRTA